MNQLKLDPSNDISKLLSEKRRMALFSRAMAFKKAGKLDEAYAEFDRYYDDYRNHPTGATALLEAIGLAHAQGDYQALVSRSELFIAKHQSHPKSASVEFDLASNLESNGQFDSAAVYFMKFARTRSSDSRAAMANIRAAKLWTLEKKFSDAAESYQYFFKSFPKDSFNPQAQLDYAYLLERMGKRDEALVQFRKYTASFPGETSRLLLALAEECRIEAEKGNRTIRSRVLELYSTLTKSNTKRPFDRIDAAVSKALVALMVSDVIALNDIRIDGARPTESLNTAQLALTGIGDMMQRVLLLNDPASVYSGYLQLGLAHEAIAQKIDQAQMPSGYTDIERRAAVGQMSVISSDLRRDAIKFYRKLVERSSQNLAEFPAVERAGQRLAALNQTDLITWSVPRPRFTRLRVDSDQSLPEIAGIRGDL